MYKRQTLTWNGDQLISLAGAVGATASPGFSTCVTTRAHAGWMDSINAAAAQQGVTGTPTLFVDGARIEVTKLTPDSLAAMINS